MSMSTIRIYKKLPLKHKIMRNIFINKFIINSGAEVYIHRNGKKSRKKTRSNEQGTHQEKKKQMYNITGNTNHTRIIFINVNIAIDNVSCDNTCFSI